MKINKNDKQIYFVDIKIDGETLSSYYKFRKRESGVCSTFTFYTWKGVCSFIAFVKAKYHNHDINIWDISGRFVGDDFAHLAKDMPAMKLANVAKSKHNRKIMTHNDGCCGNGCWIRQAKASSQKR